MSYSNEFNNLIKKVNEYSLDDVEKTHNYILLRKYSLRIKIIIKKEVG
ncbi:hypothetical protein SA950122_02532 [Staphylococcus aureus]|nr:hypothetical protein SA950122_02532 [Staphylococcus aureus]